MFIELVQVSVSLFVIDIEADLPIQALH